jgi:DNA-binding LacI/PurR family transcriptional regulator
MDLPRPTTVIAANAATGVRVLSAALGVAVPKELAIAVTHDSWLTDYRVPSLTSVEMRLRQVAGAVRQLLNPSQRMDDILVSEPDRSLHIRDSASGRRLGDCAVVCRW